LVNVLINFVIKNFEDSRYTEIYINIFENIVKFSEEHSIELQVPTESETYTFISNDFNFIDIVY